jgi:hypothetical protein
MHENQHERGRLPRFRHATCGGEIEEHQAITHRCVACGIEGDIRPATDDEGEPFTELVDRGGYLEATATYALFDGEPDPTP